MEKHIYPWQKSLWNQIQQRREGLPHAILFHGPAGIGKVDLAERFAQSLLCEQIQPDGYACGTCVSCGWFAKYSHPDYRRLRPDILDQEDAMAADDEGDGEEEASSPKTKKSASKVIRISQVRDLADFANISTHRHGNRVVLLYPAETLNTESANALLKMLEEPHPGTVFLLVSSYPESLLPTILSRCHKIPVSMPPHAESLKWLQEQGVKDAEVWLAEQGGAPLSAYALAQAGGREEMDEFLSQLARPTVEGVLKTAEKMQKTPAVQLIAWLQRWLYDIFSMKFTGVIRYYPRYKSELAVLAERADPTTLLRILKTVSARNEIADHPLAPRLFVEDMLLEYMEICS
ncbi:MAG: DNA polymerase III subunit delta' [Oxalobacter sp.]|nr:MAG: DNA polymerase III subunit delta' [Oxalobacter sp.]